MSSACGSSAKFDLKIEGHYTDGDEDAKGRTATAMRTSFEFRTARGLFRRCTRV